MRLSDNADMRKRLLTAAWLHEPFPMLISILGGTNAFVRIPFQAFSSEVIFAQAFPYRLSPPGGSLKGRRDPTGFPHRVWYTRCTLLLLTAKVKRES